MEIWMGTVKRARDRYDGTLRLAGSDSDAWLGSGFAATAAYDLDEVSYDRDGNVTSLTRRSAAGASSYQGYTYTLGSGRLSSVTTNGSTALFSYDRNGQTTAISSGPYAQSGVQYGRNGLPHQATAGGQTLRYLYDHTGQRVYESGGGGRYTVWGVGGEKGGWSLSCLK